MIRLVLPMGLLALDRMAVWSLDALGPTLLAPGPHVYEVALVAGAMLGLHLLCMGVIPMTLPWVLQGMYRFVRARVPTPR